VCVVFSLCVLCCQISVLCCQISVLCCQISVLCFALMGHRRKSQASASVEILWKWTKVYVNSNFQLISIPFPHYEGYVFQWQCESLCIFCAALEAISIIDAVLIFLFSLCSNETWRKSTKVLSCGDLRWLAVTCGSLTLTWDNFDHAHIRGDLLFAWTVQVLITESQRKCWLAFSFERSLTYDI
jgi:hypothetical protein